MRLAFSCRFSATRLASVTLTACAALALVIGAAATAAADNDDHDNGNNGGRNDDHVIYSSIPKRLPGNVASVGAEAVAFKEVGDGLVFTPGAGGTLDGVRVILSSWGCKAGHWFSNDCATPRGATFSQTITLKVYSVIDIAGTPTAGSVLATKTRTFSLPYRPSADPARCPTAPGKWFSVPDQTCYNGFAVPIAFDLSDLHVAVPAKVIVGLAYNTTHFGYQPIGESAPCFTSSGGCPYDSLNVSSDGAGARIGSVIDPNGIFINYAFPSSYCQPHIDQGNVIQLDTGPGCWTGFHPQIEVVSQERRKDRSRRHDDPSD
jgi:hypothetical protein